MIKMNLWNTKDLPEPPINTYKATNKKIDIKHLYNVFEEGTQFFEDNKFMYAEHAVLSRIVYRMKQKFRSAKDFKALEKIDKALHNYFNMDLSRNLRNFKELIPSRYKQVTYLPTKNLLDYILVRLQGSVKLMERIVETCKIAGYLLDKRMHTGHFWKIAFITFSIISRLYILAKYTAKFICQFYNKLIPFSTQLSNTSEGLPRYKFPKDLKEWMNVDWLETDDEIQIIETPTEIPEIMQFFDLVNEEDDVQFCDEYFIIKDDEDETERNLQKISHTNFKNLWELRGFDAREDVGEIIEINENTVILDDYKLGLKQTCSDIKINNTNKNDIPVAEDTNIDVDVDRDVCDYESQEQEEKPAVFTETAEETSTITLLDTPLVNNKKKKVGKFKMEKNGSELFTSNNLVRFEGSPKTSIVAEEDTSPITIIDTPSVNRKRKRIKNEIGTGKMEPETDFDSVIEIGEDTVISSDTSFSSTIDNTPEKVKKWKTKKSKKIKDSNCDIDRDMSNSVLQQMDLTLFNEINEKTSIITIPDTPTLDRKEKWTKNDVVELKIEKNKFRLDIDSSVIEIDEDTVMPSPDTSAKERTEKRLVRRKKWNTKQNGSDNMQISTSSVNRNINSDGREPGTIIIPDTSVVEKKQKRIKKEMGKLKMEISEDEFKSDCDSSVIEINEDSVMSPSGISFGEMIDEKPVKTKKWETNKPEHNGITNTQNSSLLIKNGYKVPKKMNKTKARNLNPNESKLRANVGFNEVNSAVKENKKVKKNNQNRGKINNGQKWRRHEGKKLRVDQNSLARPDMGRNELFVQNNKIHFQTSELSKTQMEKRQLQSPIGQILHLNNAVGEPCTSTFISNPRKRKMGTKDRSLAVNTLKKAISKKEKHKKMLERKLSQIKHDLKELSTNLPVDPSSVRESITNKIAKSKKNRRNKRLRTGTNNDSNSNKISPNTTLLMNNSTEAKNTSQLCEFSVTESSGKRPHKTPKYKIKNRLRRGKKLIETGPKIQTNIRESESNKPKWQNRKFPMNILHESVSGEPIRQSNRNDTNIMSKSARKRRQKKKVITETYNMPPNRPSGIGGWKNNKSSNYRQQNTKLINSPKENPKKNKRGQRKQNNY